MGKGKLQGKLVSEPVLPVTLADILIENSTDWTTCISYSLLHSYAKLANLSSKMFIINDLYNTILISTL